MRKELLPRIKDRNLRAAAARAFAVVDAFGTRRQAIVADQRLSDVGRLEAITKALELDAAPAFRMAREPIRAARTAIEARRTKMVLAAIDKSDLAAAIERQEYRTFIRSLPEAERTRLLFDKATDVKLIEAVLNAPAVVSGVDQARFEHLRDTHLRQRFGTEMDALETDEQALAEAESAMKVAENDLRTTFGSDGRVFDRLVNKPLPIWLVDRGGTISVVRIDEHGLATYPEATPAERAVGKFYRTREEFEAAVAA